MIRWVAFMLLRVTCWGFVPVALLYATWRFAQGVWWVGALDLVGAWAWSGWARRAGRAAEKAFAKATP